MLRDWAVSCSKCLRLKAVSEKLLKNSSLTSQALGGVLKDSNEDNEDNEDNEVSMFLHSAHQLWSVTSCLDRATAMVDHRLSGQ